MVVSNNNIMEGKNESTPSFLFKMLREAYRFTRGTYRLISIQKPVPKLLGLSYIRSRKFIEIDITYLCNKSCFNCNRSCTQAPSNEKMTVEQIQKFVKESIDNNVKWERIRLLGGEPTLHTNFFEILSLLLEYRKDYSPDTTIEVSTNGFGKKVNDIISKIPKEIQISNTSKKSSVSLFAAFNITPQDFILYKYADYSNGCWVISVCGIGLTPYGYYPCGVAGGIDRVFGYDYGRKKLPSPDDSMIDQLQVFCKLCGNFGYCKLTNREEMSSTWGKAYNRYKRRKPNLSLY